MPTTPNTPAGGAMGCRYRFRIERPDGSGSEWTDWRFAINRQEADYGIPTGRPHEIENLVSADAVLALVGKLDAITRYEDDAGLAYGCPYSEHTPHKDGDWIKHADLRAIRDELEALTRGEGK